MVDILVTGKKISDMDLVTEVKGNEKIPTDAVGDLAISPDQLVEYVRNSSSTSWGKIVGDIDDQADLKNKFYGINQTISTHVNSTDNPHNVTKNQIGLGNVDNTNDLDKPVSSATQEVLETKADKSYVDSGLSLKADQLDFEDFYQHEKSGKIFEFDQNFSELNGGYSLHARIMLSNGDIVRNTIANNKNDPNIDMNGWRFISQEKIEFIQDFDDLRSFDSKKSEFVIVSKYAENCAVVNQEFYLDKSDKTSIDNDLTIIVANDGARWKADISQGIDVRLAGLLSDLSNLGSSLQKVINLNIQKAISDVGFQKIQSAIFIPASLGVFNLDVGVEIPSFMQMFWFGNLIVNYDLSSGGAFWIKNTALPWEDGFLANWKADTQLSKTFNGIGGGIFITNSTRTVKSGTWGVRVGELGYKKFAVRDLDISGVDIKYFDKGLLIDNSNNFINTYKNFTIIGCNYGVAFTPQSGSLVYRNSAERISFQNFTIGNSNLAHCYMCAYGLYTFENSSFDFSYGDVFKIPALGTGVKITVDNSHVEAFSGYIVNSDEYTRLGSWHADSTVHFNDTVFIITNTSGVNLPFRKLFNLLNSGTRVLVNNPLWSLPITHATKHNKPFVALCGFDDIQSKYAVQNSTAASRPIYWMYSDCNKLLPTYNAGLLGQGRWKFNASSLGATLPQNSKDTGTGVYWTDYNSSAHTVSYGSSLDSDGHSFLSVTSTATNEPFVLVVDSLVGSISKFMAGLSVALSSITSGAVNFRVEATAYDKPVQTITIVDKTETTPSSATIKTTLPILATYTSQTVNCSTYFTDSGVDTNQYIGFFQGVDVNVKCDSVQLRIVLTGFVGTVRVKCPVFWKTPLDA